MQVRCSILACRLPGLIALALLLVVPGYGVAQLATIRRRHAVRSAECNPSSGSRIPVELADTKPDRRRSSRGPHRAGGALHMELAWTS